jgi:hypothetical protein
MIVTGRLSLATFAMIMVVLVGSFYYGSVLMNLVRLTPSFPITFVSGSLLYAFLVLCVKALCPVSMLCASLFVMAGSMMCALAIRHTAHPMEKSASWTEYMALLACLIAATMWSQDLLFNAVREENADYVYGPWQDYFTHATITSMFLNKTPLLLCDNYECSNRPINLYHYGSYVFPACLAATGQLPAYEALLAFWTPFGTTMVGLAAYSLVTGLWGSRAGILAVLALYCIPDASFYGFRNNYFGYWWLQQHGPGGNYGVACAAVALALLVQGAELASKKLIAGGVVFTFLCATFKIHIFVCILPLSLFVLLMCMPRLSAWCRVLGVLCLVVLGAVAILFMSHLQLFPSICLNGKHSTRWFCEFAANNCNATFNTSFDVYTLGRTTYQHPGRSLLILTGEAFGLLPIVYFLLLLATGHRRLVSAKCLLPFVAMLLYYFFAFCLGKNDVGGCPDEFCHRPFVWSYFLLLVVSSGLAVQLFTSESGPEVGHGRYLLALLIVCLVPLLLGRGLQHARTAFSAAFVDTRVARGLHDCSLFVRSQRPAISLVQTYDCDPRFVVGALCEHPSFLARAPRWLSASQCNTSCEYSTKLGQIHELIEAHTLEQLRAAVVSTNIRWLIVTAECNMSWPIDLRDAYAFESTGFRVYDLHAILQAKLTETK